MNKKQTFYTNIMETQKQFLMLSNANNNVQSKV